MKDRRNRERTLNQQQDIIRLNAATPLRPATSVSRGDADVLLIVNTTGGTVLAGQTLSPSGTPKRIGLNRWQVDGVATGHEPAPYVVLTQDLVAGAKGEAVGSGFVQAWVRVTSKTAGEVNAKASGSSAALRLTSEEGTQARVWWIESGTGLKRALIRLSNPSPVYDDSSGGTDDSGTGGGTGTGGTDGGTGTGSGGTGGSGSGDTGGGTDTGGGGSGGTDSGLSSGSSGSGSGSSGSGGGCDRVVCSFDPNNCTVTDMSLAELVAKIASNPDLIEQLKTALGV